MRAVLLALLVGCAPVPRPIVPPGQVRSAQEQKDTAVSLEVYCKSGGEWVSRSGSGVIVSSYQVMTEYHVVQCGNLLPTIYVYNFQGRSWKAYVESTWKARDVVRLELPDDTTIYPSPKPPLIRVTPLSKDESLFIETAAPDRDELYGAALGDEYDPNFYYDAPTQPGNSGSGVWDQQGRLVGFHGGRIKIDGVDHAWGSLVTPDMVPH